MNSTMNEAQSISAYGPARSIVEGNPIEPDELKRMQAYWNATLFLSAGMIYLRDNLLLREPLKAEILQNIFPRQDAIPDPPTHASPCLWVQTRQRWPRHASLAALPRAQEHSAHGPVHRNGSR